MIVEPDEFEQKWKIQFEEIQRLRLTADEDDSERLDEIHKELREIIESIADSYRE